jgi:two-component system response regulator AtoC
MARLLLAEDDEGVRSFLAESLEQAGHDVVQTADGEEALRALAGHSFDLLVTDLRMPKLDGMALLRRVRAEQPELEVIVLTAHGAVESAVEAMRLGAFDYLQKPLASPAQIRLLAARALERRALLTLRDQVVRDDAGAPPLTWGDPTMQRVAEALRKVAATTASVLLIGESGSGKEIAARALHRWSARASGPFVAINCAALSDALLESELFGHEKGAFTGAHAQRRGRIELAEGGTFFLDEVGELKLELQAKLLRVLQERQFERVGGGRTLTANVRWVAATNRDLAGMLAAGRFREDLYHRLAVFPVQLPPLRARRADIIPLARLLLGQLAAELGKPNLHLADDALAVLAAADWPGNIRELRNTLERAAILADGDIVAREHLWLDPTTAAPAPLEPGGTLEQAERALIERALATHGGHRQRAAQSLGIGLRTLYEKLKRYGLG